VLSQVAQIGGALLILCAYGALQGRRLHARQVSYLLLNVTGSAILAVLALMQRQWGFLLLEGVWAIVSALAIISIVLAARRRHDRPSDNGSAAGDPEQGKPATSAWTYSGRDCATADPGLGADLRNVRG
jgi:hypothetical protein